MALTDNIRKDSPTNNFATCNPLANGGTLEEGNLRFKHVGNNATKSTLSTFSLPNSGTYYWEIYEETAIPNNSRVSFGICDSKHAVKAAQSQYIIFETDSHGYTDRTNVGNPSFVVNGNNTGTFGSDYTVNYGSGGVISFYVNMDTAAFTVGRNNAAYKSYSFTKNENIFYTPFFNLYCEGSQTLSQIVNFGQDATFAGVKSDTAGPYTDANGHGEFYYSPPSGALALCTQNIPTPSVDSAAGDEPEDFFKCSLYTATGSTQSISVGFQPDLVWIKGRDATRVPIISDSVRGITYYIIPSITNGETNISGGVADNLVKSTSTTGFTIGSDSAVNVSSEKFVAWCWKAGGAPASDGVAMVNGTATTTAALKTSASASITPTRMSVNTKTSFSIVKYTSPNNSSDQTVPHGLSSAPNWIIVKNLDNTYNWDIYHSSVSNSGIFTNAAINSRTAFGTVNNSIFTTKNTFTHNSTHNYIAYCWHSVPGYSAFGSYTGNGSSDGPFVYTGFRPSWIIVKWISGGSGLTTGSWRIMDTARNPYNPATLDLMANEAVSETTYGSDDLDMLSNGFKWRSTGCLLYTSDAADE